MPPVDTSVVSDPGSSVSQGWDAILNDAVASTGVDPAQPFADDSSSSEPATQETPQSSGEPTSPTPASAPSGDVVAAPAADDVQPVAFTFKGEGGADATIEGSMVIKGDGLYVPEAAIPQVQQALHRATALEAQNRTMYESHRSLEKATEWRQTGADGKETVLTGAPAMEQFRLAYGGALAENQILKPIPEQIISTLMADDPRKFVGLDANGEVAWRPDALASLKQMAQEHIARESGLLKREVALTVRSHMGAQPRAEAAPQHSGSVEPARAAAVVDQFASAWKADGLTGEDKQFLSGMVEKFIRPATDDDRRADFNIKIGEPMVDKSFGDLVLRTAQSRTATATAAQKAGEAAKLNAQTNKGRTPPVNGRRPAPTTPAPTQPVVRKSKADAWENVFQDAVQGIEA